MLEEPPYSADLKPWDLLFVPQTEGAYQVTRFKDIQKKFHKPCTVVKIIRESNSTQYYCFKDPIGAYA